MMGNPEKGQYTFPILLSKNSKMGTRKMRAKWGRIYYFNTRP